MFIRPVGVTVHGAQRPAGHPLLQGLLARAAGAAESTAGAVHPGEPPRRGLLARAVQAAESRPEPPPPAKPDRDRDRELRKAEPAEPEPAEPEPAEPPAPLPQDAHPPEHPHTGEAVAPAHLVAELTQLADLAREGLLTPEEFTAAKALLLHG
ncbi:SHOCT domain-containing protein [Streptomyces sp. ISL-94]|uniref:SHOCT domain-containing protein n=1 Tax=Streptomyces sp. ISL-94 TaxID=2819190 RepID=UPI001BE93C30|nr:SHOCT domain-containing protein [Streptomyces sp. ISL-94]MBT2482288.1 SHOCT domain-containing protein [Streptomyces sp. ISL-94]